MRVRCKGQNETGIIAHMANTLLLAATLGLCFARLDAIAAQATTAARLVFNQARGQQPPPAQLNDVAKKLGLEIQTSTGPITVEALKGARLLYLRAPSGEFTPSETEAIVGFVKGGGSLLVVLDE